MRSSGETITRIPGLHQYLDVDENGAPVTFEPSRWLVCFVPGLRGQFWHRFVHRTHKHVLMLKPNPDGTWTLFEPWWTRLLVRTISTDQAIRFLQWAAMGDVLLVEEHVPGHGCQIRGWSNCASLAVFALGRSYCVWSPHALFKRLLAEDRTSRVDVADFVHRYAGARSGRQNHELPNRPPLNAPAGLRSALVDLGRAAFETSTAPRLVGPHCAAAPEAGRHDVRAAVAEHLRSARDRGELIIEDCQVAADQFLDLLRSDPFIRAVVGLRVAPTDREIETAASAIVDLFLGGIRDPVAATLHANDTDPFGQHERPSHAQRQSDESDAGGRGRTGDASRNGLRDCPRFGQAGQPRAPGGLCVRAQSSRRAE